MAPTPAPAHPSLAGLVKGQTVTVRHTTGIIETGTITAIRTYGGYPQVDMLWMDGTRCWVRPSCIISL